MIIDPGEQAEEILELAQNSDIEFILLTHGHYDHIGAVSQVKKATSAKIVIHKSDIYLIDSAHVQARYFGFPAPEPFSIDRFISEGDLLSFGSLNAKVISTPGHSPGSVCFLIDGNAFVGDTLFFSSIGRSDFPGGDSDTLISSIKKKLFTLPDETRVYCGHGPSTSIEREKKYNPFIL